MIGREEGALAGSGVGDEAAPVCSTRCRDQGPCTSKRRTCSLLAWKARRMGRGEVLGHGEASTVGLLLRRCMAWLGLGWWWRGALGRGRMGRGKAGGGGW